MGKTNIEGGEPMIADELKVLFDELKTELVSVKSELILLNYDVQQARIQLDRIEYAINNPPPTPDPKNYTIEKL
jgi:hypothetical protein